MSYQLNEEQQMIQAMVRDFARSIILPTAAERDKTKEFPHDIIRQLGELGLMGMSVPQEYNGAGVDTICYSLALQEIGYACASTAVIVSVHNSVSCGPIYQFGSDFLKDTYLTSLAAGKKLGCFALTEPSAGSDPASQKSTAKKDGNSYILNGSKAWITSGKSSDIVVATAYTDKGKKHRGISAFVLDKGMPGFTVGREEDKMGQRSSDCASLIFEDCRVPAENLLGEEGQGFIIAMTALDEGRIGIASMSVGIAQACLDAAMSYSKEREQFGAPLSKFQGIRWMIADMAVQTEAARLLTFNVAAMKDRGERFTAEASMAKLFASESANRCAYTALQIHGGYGYSTEYPVERYYRDARVTTIYEGTSEVQRIVIANSVLGS
ncbi:MAG: acyl-CoA dehydrogenase [Deltaproteobacteria bacterium]|nr:acyl-CoA dehydrogenase [Deltaproteobacteria bacterium]MBW2078015.1 acyl-CoA dehydrogenase [Deltaproteobacteria bacterium]MBW2310604.1 acyl-CoA dehydrogenase [Deltaproteobacteria bacterium]RLB30540.1 MAG: acyl-CoA dehydrogenase [Deltaproteobacteria bacterium]